MPGNLLRQPPGFIFRQPLHHRLPRRLIIKIDDSQTDASGVGDFEVRIMFDHLPRRIKRRGAVMGLGQTLIVLLFFSDGSRSF